MGFFRDKTATAASTPPVVPFSSPSQNLAQFALSPNPPNSQSLGAVLHALSGAINSVFRTPIWVTATIGNDVSESGHAYYELVDYDDRNNAIAKCRAILWEKNRMRAMASFKAATGSGPVKGMKVLIEVSASLHPVHGLSLTIQQFDPRFTMGQAAVNLQLIRQQLAASGIAEKNRQLQQPKDFFRVAVISPPNSKGLADFCSQGKSVSSTALQNARLVDFDFYDASFQGANAALTICAAISKIEVKHRSTPFDAIVIIRGGGDVAGIEEINQLSLAEAICNSPIPVITGIGHEVDRTICDEVACLALDTPTAVISFIFKTVTEKSASAMQHVRNIQRFSQSRIDQKAAKIDRHTESLNAKFSAKIQQVNAQTRQAMQERIRPGLAAILQKRNAAVDSLSRKIYATVSTRIRDTENKVQQSMHASIRVGMSNVLSHQRAKGESAAGLVNRSASKKIQSLSAIVDKQISGVLHRARGRAALIYTAEKAKLKTIKITAGVIAVIGLAMILAGSEFRWIGVAVIVASVGFAAWRIPKQKNRIDHALSFQTRVGLQLKKIS